LLQESNAAQPHIGSQPLQPADPTIPPATEWVTNLRNELPSIPRPQIPDFEALYGEDFVEDHGLQPTDDAGGPSTSAPAHLTQEPAEYNVASLTLDDIVPSAEFQEDVAFVQSTN
jgi:hypothetical protein